MSKFKIAIDSKYQVRCYHQELLRLIEDAEHNLGKAEDELKKIRDQYNKLVADENVTLEQLLKLEDEMNEAEKERDDAEKEYEKARHTTIQDLKEEHAYQDWKDRR